MNNLNKFYLLLILILSAGIGLALWYYIHIHTLWVYLITLTVISFLFYGYDKYQAIHNNERIPEAVLHLLTLAGGTLGAFAGQHIFRHKTKKLRFRLIFIIIVLVQISVILLRRFRENN